MPYESLLSCGIIRPHRFDQQETRVRVEEMFALIERDLEAATSTGLDPDLHYIFAYSAARTAAEVVMLSEGFRPGRAIGSHAAVFVFLGTVDHQRWQAEAVFFDQARQTRNVLQYQRAGVVGVDEAVGLAERAATFTSDVREWLRRHHPDFYPPAGSEPS